MKHYKKNVTYYKIYHYSRSSDLLDAIDPDYYGSGVSGFSELKKTGKHGVNKSFYYVQDQPESIVSDGSFHRYEVYLPGDWKNLIYDIGADPENFYEKAVNTLKAANEFPYPYYVADTMESLLFESGYKGWTNSNSALTHAIAVFYKLSTHKPVCSYTAYDYVSGAVLEEYVVKQKTMNMSLYCKKPLLFNKLPVKKQPLNETKSKPISSRFRQL